jgi:hypothetical protein
MPAMRAEERDFAPLRCNAVLDAGVVVVKNGSAVEGWHS